MNYVYYFAYGMLTDPSLVDGDIIDTGILKDYSIELLQHANIVESSGNNVHGVIWKIHEDHLKSLDFMEGYPKYYTRIIKQIYTNNNIYDCHIYKMTDESRDSLIDTTPSNSYLDILFTSYKFHDLPMDQLDNALEN